MLTGQIQLQTDRGGQSNEVQAGQSQLFSLSEIGIDEKPKIRERAIDNLLRRIVAAPHSPRSHRRDGYDDRSTLSQDPLRVRDWAQLSTEPSGALFTLLDRVDLLERKGAELSRATNWTYWSLGCAYRAFCEVRDSFMTTSSLTCSYSKAIKHGMIALSRTAFSPNCATLKASDRR